MLRILVKLALLLAAAAGGVVVWQRRNETPPTAPSPLPPAEPFMTAAPDPSAAHAGDGEAAAQAAGAPFAAAPAGPADDLKRISGIGPKLEGLLNAQGITTFAQLAALDDEGIDRLQERLPQFPGRIRRDDWVGQARRLADG